MSILTDLYDQDIERLTDERNEAVALLEALDNYVGHNEGCNALSGAPECSCGFDDLYTRVRAAVRGASPRAQAQGETDAD